MNNTKSKTAKFVLAAILIAVVAVLQTVAAVFPLKVFGLSISLVLIPIVIAGIYCGVWGGVIVGASFGIVVFIHCVTGLDPTGAFLFQLNTLYTFIATVGRAAIAGLVPALVYKAVSTRLSGTAGAVISAVCAPVVNTLVFVLCLLTLFPDTLATWASDAGKSIITFIIVGMVGFNFLFELATTTLLTPAISKAISKIR